MLLLKPSVFVANRLPLALAVALSLAACSDGDDGSAGPQGPAGDAAETGDESATPLEHATAKLARKGCDLLMCNDVSGGATFGAEDNVGWILDADGAVDDVPHGSKHAVAAQILDAVSRRVAARG